MSAISSGSWVSFLKSLTALRATAKLALGTERGLLVTNSFSMIYLYFMSRAVTSLP